MLWTEEIKETIEFYSNVLGFICKSYDDDWGWAALERDGVAIMLAQPNEHMDFEGPLFTGSFYFRTDNVDELWEELNKKVKVCYPIENFDYGMREFAIFDNNGYILQFGQDIRN